MPEGISEQTRAKIRKFCADLASNHALDPDTRDEICGHLEDKLAAYVSGEVRPTEEDALVLARAHFGDADRVARMLSGLAAESDRNLARRKRMIRKLAISLIVLALLPCALAVVFTLGVSADLLDALCPVLFFAIVEACVVLAARVDVRRMWQRLTAAALVLPSIAVYLIMISFSVTFTRAVWSEGAFIRLLCVSAALIALAEFAGHVFLAALVLVPPPTRPRPLAGKA